MARPRVRKGFFRRNCGYIYNRLKRLGTQDRSIWLNVECCGIFCAGLTHFLLYYGSYATSFHVIIPWLYPEAPIKCALNLIFFNACIFLALLSHVKCMCTNPGAVPEDAIPVDRGIIEPRMCRRCVPSRFKPERAHHCSICRRCVVKMDHHCPWVNNCVGLSNHKFFILFVCYTFLVSLYAIILVTWRLALTPIDEQGKHSLSSTFYIVFLVIEALLFGLFTMCMACEQLTSVATNMSGIQRMKIRRSKKGPNYSRLEEGSSSNDEDKDPEKMSRYREGLREVFGDPGHFTWRWLLPVRIKFKEPEITFGYCCDTSRQHGEETAVVIGANDLEYLPE